MLHAARREELLDFIKEQTAIKRDDTEFHFQFDPAGRTTFDTSTGSNFRARERRPAHISRVVICLSSGRQLSLCICNCSAHHIYKIAGPSSETCVRVQFFHSLAKPSRDIMLVEKKANQQRTARTSAEALRCCDECKRLQFL
jgi:hypothetical protein